MSTTAAEAGTRTITFLEAINEALAEEMRRDERVLVLGEDVVGGAARKHLEEDDAWGGVMGVTKGLVQEFGRERVRDTPISEAGFVGAAAGAAISGLRPVVELMFVDFHGICWDQIFNQTAKLRYMLGGQITVPLVIRTMIGAGLGEAGQHSSCHYSLFTHIPGLKCVVPSTPADAKGLLISAIRDDDPVVFFEHKMLYPEKGTVSDSGPIPLGSAEIKRAGTDVTIVALSLMVKRALEAAELLASEGISSEVVDLRSTSPIDERTVVESVNRTGRLVIVDEDNPRCSVATDVAAFVAEQSFDYLEAPIKRVSAPHTPVPFSPPLENFYMPSVDRICEAARTVAD
jgi:pyruvate/2-oxoglutarate/acetoin dehydrogenase E1 component